MRYKRACHDSQTDPLDAPLPQLHIQYRLCLSCHQDGSSKRLGTK